MSRSKLQIGLAGALLLAGVAGLLVQTRSNAALRSDLVRLRQENAGLAGLRAENLQLARTSAEVADMRNDDAELARLGEESAALKTRAQHVARAEQRRRAEAASREVYDLDQLDVKPRATGQGRPQFPVAMRRAGIGGQVVVEFVVGPNGEVVNPRAIKTTINPTPGETDGDTKGEPFTVAANGAESQPGAVIDGVAVADMARMLGESAVQAVSQWKFTAGQKGGQAVGAKMQIPIVYALNGNGPAKPAAPPPEPKR
jgi:hypothetical protein